MLSSLPTTATAVWTPSAVVGSGPSSWALVMPLESDHTGAEIRRGARLLCECLREAGAPAPEAYAYDRPVPILALGPTAAAQFGIKDKIGRVAGAAHALIDRYVLPSLHPVTILRGGKATEHAALDLIADIRHVVELAGGAKPLTPSIEVETSDSVRAFNLISSMSLAEPVAIDVETDFNAQCNEHDNCPGHDSLEPRFAALSAIGLADSTHAISIAVEAFNPAVEIALRYFLRSRASKIMHNRVYDMVVLERSGLPVRGRIEDTMLLDHNVNPGCAHDLQRAVTRQLLVKPWKRRTHDSLAELLRYNAHDAAYTRALWVALQRQATKEEG